MLPEHFSNAELTAVIEKLHADRELREAFGRKARAYVREKLSPRKIADQYYSAIEWQSTFSQNALTQRAAAELVAIELKNDNEADWLAIARAMNQNSPAITYKRQLLVDISGLIKREAGPGVQRVTRSILKELLTRPPEGFRVEPVFIKNDESNFRYARSFAAKFLDYPAFHIDDAPVELRRDDMFLGLDLHHGGILNSEILTRMRHIGIRIYFVICDMFPIVLKKLVAFSCKRAQRWRNCNFSDRR